MSEKRVKKESAAESDGGLKFALYLYAILEFIAFAVLFYYKSWRH